MKFIHHITGFSAALALGACSTAPPAAPVSVPSVGSVTHNVAADTYTVTVNGTPTNLGTPTSSFATRISFNSASHSARGFTNADVTAIGGMTEGVARTPFAGVTGTFGSVPTSGTATYSGDITFIYPSPISTTATDFRTRTLSLTADFATGAVSQNFDGVVISGNITANAFTGTVAWSGKTAPLAGGFYGTNTAAGAFSSAELAGAFLGTKP